MVPIEKVLRQVWGEDANADQTKITISYAQTLDGSIALRRSNSVALSCPDSIQFTHHLRANHQAIMVGIGTVLADNPRLSVRNASGPDPQPIVLDSNLRFPLESNLLGSPRPVWIITSKQADREKAAILESKGARLFFLPTTHQGRIHLQTLVDMLPGLQINSLMVEGGASLITSFLAERIADGLILTITPYLTGGLHAVEKLIVKDDDVGSQSSKVRLPGLAQTHTAQLGCDVIIWGHINWDAYK